MSAAQSVAEAIRQGRDLLRQASIDAPQTDLRHLMADALEIPPDRVLLRMHDALTGPQAARFQAHVARRARREPVSHILGYRAFYGRRFEVSPAVLDPRPETETLIALALEQRFSEVLDLGTGSGCIALSLLCERTGARATATDVSAQALEVAARNAAALGVAARVTFRRADWWTGLAAQRFALIVSNPPYISEEGYAHLAPELSYEPQIALTPGGDGLDAYRAIAAGLPAHLAPGGRVLLEFGAGQGGDVAALIAAAGLTDITLHPDLDGRDRVLSARAPEG